MKRKAVGAIIINNQGEYLVAHKVKMENDKAGGNIDKWDFIKGGVKESETSLEALRREIKEETGVENYQIIGEMKEKICFEFSKDERKLVGYDSQETKMYVVYFPENEILYCEDGELSEFRYYQKQDVASILSNYETKIFWTEFLDKMEHMFVKFLEN